eukprot:3252336-Karenia_brevis.AAC.1
MDDDVESVSKSSQWSSIHSNASNQDLHLQGYTCNSNFYGDDDTDVEYYDDEDTPTRFAPSDIVSD